MSLDVDRLADAMLAGAQALIAKAVAPLVARVEALTAEKAKLYDVLGEMDGRMVLLAAGLKEIPTREQIEDLKSSWRESHVADFREEPDIAAVVQEAVSAAVAGIQPPEVPDVAPMVAEAVKAAVEALPPAQDLSGFATKEEVAAVRDAIPVVPETADLSGFATKADVDAVRDAMPVVPEAVDLSGFATKADVEAVRAAIPPAQDISGLATKEEVAEVAAAMPTIPEIPDVSGFATKSEVAEAVAGIRIPDPVPGKPGAGIAEAKMNADGELILKRDDGETFNVGKVRGADGFGFDDMSAEDGERDFSIVFAKGERTERFTFEKGVILDRGVWREGDYRKGDGVTWAGSFWIAQRSTSDKPETSDAWRLSVKKGKDGKHGGQPPPRPDTVKR
jgi:hypothetical protein